MMLVQVVQLDTRSNKQDPSLLSRPELEQMITWETNNLYEYLKELYDQKHEDLMDDRYKTYFHHSSKHELMHTNAVNKCCKHKSKLAVDLNLCLKTLFNESKFPDLSWHAFPLPHGRTLCAACFLANLLTCIICNSSRATSI